MNISILENKQCIWQTDVALSRYCTYKIGGKAKYFAKATSKEELSSALKYCKQNNLRYYLLGKGSNTLFDDRGFNGAVILNALLGFEQNGDFFDILAGTSFPLFAIKSAKMGFGGLEYGAGIPGSIGGAIFMNAGASGQEISNLVESVDFIDDAGELTTYKKDEISFKYRWSNFHEMNGAIASVRLKLYPDNSARKKQIELVGKRKISQPLNQASCGCVFRNGADFVTGRLIEELGLKGKTIGGAQISTTHANFIVNAGSAKAEDVKALVKIIEDTIAEKTGYILEREMRYVSY